MYCVKQAGLFVTSAVESIQDEILESSIRAHPSRFCAGRELCREAGLVLSPTFVPFTPWTTWDGYRDLLRLIAELDLVDQIAPVQLTLRLLVPEGSRLLKMPDLPPFSAVLMQRHSYTRGAS